MASGMNRARRVSQGLNAMVGRTVMLHFSKDRHHAGRLAYRRDQDSHGYYLIMDDEHSSHQLHIPANSVTALNVKEGTIHYDKGHKYRRNK